MIRTCDAEITITFHFFCQLQVQCHSHPSVPGFAPHQLSRDLPASQFIFQVLFDFIDVYVS